MKNTYAVSYNMKPQRRNFSLSSQLLVKIHSLFVYCCNITCYSLQNSLVARYRSCSLQKITRYLFKNLLVTRCRSCSLQEITRYSLQITIFSKRYDFLGLSNSLYLLQIMECNFFMQLIIVKIEYYFIILFIIIKIIK